MLPCGPPPAGKFAVLQRCSAAFGCVELSIEGFRARVGMAVVWADSTCLKANIHFPVGWVLLRDGVRMLAGHLLTIRSHGPLHRMPEPESFLRKMNALCLGMTAGAGTKTAGKTDRKEERKKIPPHFGLCLTKQVCKVASRDGGNFSAIRPGEIF